MGDTYSPLQRAPGTQLSEGLTWEILQGQSPGNHARTPLVKFEKRMGSRKTQPPERECVTNIFMTPVCLVHTPSLIATGLIRVAYT